LEFNEKFKENQMSQFNLNSFRSSSIIRSSNSHAFRYFTSYKEWYKKSIVNKEEFWNEVANDLKWDKKWNMTLDFKNGNLSHPLWFEGGKLNTCYNAIDFHIEKGRGEQNAIIYDSPVTLTKKKLTFNELHKQVTNLAGVLNGIGAKKGDRVIIYNPMIPETAVAMLACVRLGLIHCVVFGGFSSDELATRIDDCHARFVISSSCGIEGHKVTPYKPILDHAVEISKHKPEKCIIFQRPQLKANLVPGRDEDWNEIMNKFKPFTDYVPVESSHPLYVLYTSGTTGKPKGIVHDTGGYSVALKWTMPNIYGIDSSDIWWASSDFGWVVGHSYILYAPLLNGSTTIIFEGKPVGTPDPGVFWRVLNEHKVKSLFTAPTVFRAIKKEDPNAEYLKKYSLPNFKVLFLAGERADPDTLMWAEKILNRPVIDHWWMTETGWPITAGFVDKTSSKLLFPTRYGSGGKAVPGYDLQVLDDNGHLVSPNTTGNLLVKLPLPPGCLTGIWNNEERFINAYMRDFHGYFKTGDAGFIDEDGYVSIMSRTDDIINVAGHRLSTGAIEEILASHPSVAESAVFGAYDEIKGMKPFATVVLKNGANSQGVVQELITMVREKLGPVYSFKDAVIVKRLPKTRSGKILRGFMKKIADNESFKLPATIDDPNILDEIKQAFDEYFKTHQNK